MSQYLSKSRLDLIHRSPYLYWWKYISGEYIEPEPTPALTFGKAFHCRALEPSEWGKRYTIAPMIDRRTKEGKERWQEFLEATAGKEIITRDQDVQIEAMHRSLMRHPMANHLLTCAGESEQQLDWELDGQPYRGVLDKLTDSGFIVDIKTTDDASPRGFAYSVKKYRYHVQAAMYLDGVAATGTKPEAFILIAIEKAAPYLCAVYYLTDADIEAGREAYKADVETYRRCMSLNDWPQYGTEVMPLNLNL